MGVLDPNSWANALSDDPTGSKAAAQTSANTQMNMFTTTQANLAPFMQTGTAANTTLANQMPQHTAPYSLDKYNASPEAQVTQNAMTQMLDQLKASGAAGGNLGSGNVATALQKNAAQLALQGYQTGLQDYTGQNLNTYSMYQGLAGAGQNAAANLGGFGANVANNIGAQGINAAASNFGAKQSGMSNLSNIGTNAFSNYLNNLWGSGGSGGSGSGGDPSGGMATADDWSTYMMS